MSKIRNLLGGFSAALVALPQAIAFGVTVYVAIDPSLSGAGAIAGILGVIVLGIVNGSVGRNPILISTPSAAATAYLAAMVLQLKGQFTGLSREQLLLILLLTGITAGLLQLLLALFKGGRLIKFVPYPVIAGYLSAVAVIIFFGQIARAFPELHIARWSDFSWQIFHWVNLPVLVVTVTLVFLAAKISKRVPAPIIALSGGMVTFALIGLTDGSLFDTANSPYLVGRIRTGGQIINLPPWQLIASISPAIWPKIFASGAMLAMILSVDTLKTMVILDNLKHVRADSDKVLRGLGVANTVSSLVGGMPGSGSANSSLINMNSGASHWSSVVYSGIFAMVILLFLSDYAAYIPIAALAGLLVASSIRLFDTSIFQLLKKRSTRLDFAVAMLVIITGITYNLIVAAGAGIALSIFLFVRNQIRDTVIRSKTRGDRKFSNKSRMPDEMQVLRDHGHETIIYSLGGNLFFGTTDQLYRDIEAELKTSRNVVLSFKEVHSIDFTAVHMLELLDSVVHKQGGELLLCSLVGELTRGVDFEGYLSHAAVAHKEPHWRIFPDANTSLMYLEEKILSEHGQGIHKKLTFSLSEMDVFTGCDAAALTELSSIVTTEKYEASRPVFLQGSHSEELYFIGHGVVDIVLPAHDGPARRLSTFAQGDFFGDMAFLDSEERSADAIAAAGTILYSLKRADFEAFCTHHHKFGEVFYRNLARILAHRLRQSHHELQAAL
ncbi:MAG TPA: SulP family inorganic anion transporter [Turneriella sp.]|nr:SulP family inorganic anion transporter [Turneriella sp.]